MSGAHLPDRHWLSRAFEHHRWELHRHLYRLAGNVPDADDLLQETFLRAWQARDRFEGRSSARTWLYRIATNTFLDSRKSAARRTVPVGDAMEWSAELGPYPDALLGGLPDGLSDRLVGGVPDGLSGGPVSGLVGGLVDGLVGARETVELALIAALRFLPPRQRAAFLLRDIHGWTPSEIAELFSTAVPPDSVPSASVPSVSASDSAVSTSASSASAGSVSAVSVPAVNSLLQRGRETLRRHMPADPADWRRPPLTRADEQILQRYARARRPEDFHALLTDDVRLTMPPEPPVLGRPAVAEFLGRPLDWRTFPAHANGRPALINYLRTPGSAEYRGQVVDVLRIEDGRIAEINAFVGEGHVAAFGVPVKLAV